MQLRGVGAEETEQMPEKKQTRREGEEKLIRHLRGQPGGVVARRFPHQTPDDTADEFELSHLRRDSTLPLINIHPSLAVIPDGVEERRGRTGSLGCVAPRPDDSRMVGKRVLIVTAGFG